MNHILINKNGDQAMLRQFDDHILIIREYQTKAGLKQTASVSDGTMKTMLQVYKWLGYNKLVSY